MLAQHITESLNAPQLRLLHVLGGFLLGSHISAHLPHKLVGELATLIAPRCLCVSILGLTYLKDKVVTENE